MTTDQKMQLLTILGSSIDGAAGGALGARQQDQQNRMTQQDRMLDWMKNQSNVGMQLQQNRQQQAQVGLNAMPLGLEQQYLQKQRMMQALLPQLAKFQSARPTDPGIAAAYRPGSNVLAGFASNPQLQQAFSDQATGSSMANYRKLVAQADPRVQFGGLSNYGLDGSFDKEVDDVRLTALADQKSFEQSQQDYAQAQLNMVQQQQQNKQKKGGGFWGGVGSVLKVAAPIAAMAIPGVGPVAAAAIAGGGTALGSKMQGQGWGSALGQGTMAGAMSGVGKSLAQGKGFNPFNEPSKGLNNAMSAASLPQMSTPFVPQQGAGQLQQVAGPGPLSMGNAMTTPRGVAQNAPTYPMENKVKMAITGSQGSPNPMNVQGPPTPPSRQQGIPLNPSKFPVPPYQPQGQPRGQNIGERSLWNDLTTPLLPDIDAVANTMADTMDRPTLPRTPYPMVNQANAMVNGFMAGAVDGLGDYITGMTSPLGLGATVAAPFARPAMGAARGLMARPTPQLTTLTQAAGKFPGIAAGKPPVTPFGQGFPGFNPQSAQQAMQAQQNIANIMATMAKNGGQNNAAINMAAQPYYRAVPGRITQTMDPQMLKILMGK